MSEPNSVSHTFLIFKAIKFILISYIISIILILVLSTAVVYTDAPEAMCSPSVKVITFFGAFLSSLLTARNHKKRGWLLGAFVGGINIMLLILLGAVSYGHSLFSMQSLYMTICGMVSGMAGGIVGVNMSDK